MSEPRRWKLWDNFVWSGPSELPKNKEVVEAAAYDAKAKELDECKMAIENNRLDLEWPIVKERDELDAELTRLREREARLVDALKYYACEENWKEQESEDGRFIFKACVALNGNYVAREALAQLAEWEGKQR